MLMHATIVWSLIAQASLLENVGLQSPHDIDSIVAAHDMDIAFKV
jgi:hypothetical protein